MPKPQDMAASVQAAESLAIEALGFLAADPERLDRFLALSGLGPDNLRQAAAEPGFLAAVLDHVASDESLMVTCAAALGRSPEALQRARHRLVGPDPAGHL